MEHSKTVICYELLIVEIKSLLSERKLSKKTFLLTLLQFQNITADSSNIRATDSNKGPLNTFLL